MGEQKRENWSLQPMSHEAFVRQLSSDQPFIPGYFPFDVDLNKKGAPAFGDSIGKVKLACQDQGSFCIKRLAANYSAFGSGRF
jgi:hydroxyacylglutathione hydrolase